MPAEITPPTCPYCNSTAKLIDSVEIYKKKSYGNVWACANYPKCDAYVGVHPTGKPLGRLANKELRKAKIEAHGFFDVLWRERAKRSKLEPKDARTKAYEWLAAQMRLDKKTCHLGLFDVAQCKRVAELCAPIAGKYMRAKKAEGGL